MIDKQIYLAVLSSLPSRLLSKTTNDGAPKKTEVTQSSAPAEVIVK